MKWQETENKVFTCKGVILQNRIIMNIAIQFSSMKTNPEHTLGFIGLWVDS